MEKIHSYTGTLLAIIVKYEDFDKARTEVVPESEFMQGALICVNDGDKFRPHKHIFKPLKSVYDNQIKAQECWIVMSGAILVTIYNEDDEMAIMIRLNQGDGVFLLHGGHTFECLENDTRIWELKTGPYEGQSKDKIFLV